MQKIYYIDGVYQSKWLSKFINLWVFLGKQQMSEQKIYLSFFLIKKKLNICPLFFFFEVLEKIKPIVGLKIYKKKNRKLNKISAGSYILEVSAQYKKAIFWLSKAIKIREGFNFFVKIFQEFYDIIYLNSGLALKKKKEYYSYAMLFKKIKKFKW